MLVFSFFFGEFMKARIYILDDPRFNQCTLFTEGNVGLIIIQQRYNKTLKCTWWGSLNRSLTKRILKSENFIDYFDENAAPPVGELYPVFEVRKVMWALRMRPLPKEIWETKFY